MTSYSMVYIDKKNNLTEIWPKEIELVIQHYIHFQFIGVQEIKLMIVLLIGIFFARCCEILYFLVNLIDIFFNLPM